MFHQIPLFLNLGTPEMILIMFVALLLFGGKKLPELARGLGKGLRDFKEASEGLKTEINNQINQVEEAKTEVATSIDKSLAEPASAPVETHAEYHNQEINYENQSTDYENQTYENHGGHTDYHTGTIYEEPVRETQAAQPVAKTKTSKKKLKTEKS
jgi:sec-independent protein translocase protein TatA